MKNLLNLGTVLNKTEQKSINGGGRCRYIFCDGIKVCARSCHFAAENPN